MGPRLVTRALALEMAEEQIAYWRGQHFEAHAAWRALGMPICGAETWDLVRRFLVRWTLAHAQDTRRAA